MSLQRIRDDSFQFQADVVPEEQIIAKIDRELEDRHSLTNFDELIGEELKGDGKSNVDRYELIKFFKAYRYPKMTIAVVGGDDRDTTRAIGYALGQEQPHYNMGFNEIGQAQLWYSTSLKKCFLEECLISVDKPQITFRVWSWLLGYIKSELGMEEVYTHDSDPVYPFGYEEFLTVLGFKELKRKGVVVKDGLQVQDPKEGENLL